MSLLAIDTSTKAMGLAIYDGSKILFESSWHSQNYHTVELAPSIQVALSQSGLKASDLEALAVAIGPGSFTGLRIGLAFVKGLAFAERLDILTVPTLDVLAAGQPLSDLPMAAVLQAGRNRLAVGWYVVEESAWASEGELELLTAEELSAAITRPSLVCGELEPDAQRLLRRKRKNVRLSSPAWNVRRPAILAELAWTRWKDGEGEHRLGLGPKYLQTDQALPQ